MIVGVQCNQERRCCLDPLAGVEPWRSAQHGAGTMSHSFMVRKMKREQTSDSVRQHVRDMMVWEGLLQWRCAAYLDLRIDMEKLWRCNQAKHLLEAAALRQDAGGLLECGAVDEVALC